MKEAQTDYHIHPLLSQRWSPRAFNGQPLTEEEMMTLFEAARWSASSRNEQPWRFVYGLQGTPAFDRIFDTLMEGNQIWAKNAGALVAVCGKTHHDYKGRENRTWQYDLGLAMGNFTVQATAMELWLHQMGGVELEEMKSALKLPDGIEPFVAIAVGRRGDIDDLPENLKASETASRTRESLSQLVFEGQIGS
jgi:nitroreductase